MSMTVDQFVSEARQLPLDLRAELLDRLGAAMHGEAPRAWWGGGVQAWICSAFSFRPRAGTPVRIATMRLMSLGLRSPTQHGYWLPRLLPLVVAFLFLMFASSVSICFL